MIHLDFLFDFFSFMIDRFDVLIEAYLKDTVLQKTVMDLSTLRDLMVI